MQRLSETPEIVSDIQIDSAIAEALQGNRVIQIKVKEEGYTRLPYLVAMARSGGLSLGDGCDKELRSVNHNNNWGRVDRTILVTLTKKFDRGKFISTLSNALEEIAVPS